MSRRLNLPHGLARALRVAGLLLGASLLAAGCATVTVPPPAPNVELTEKLRAMPLAKMRVGSFVLASGKPAEMDRTVGGLRGSSLTPADGSFARQLRSELETALRSASLLDDASSLLVQGELTDSQVDAAIGTGTARLAARFVLTRGGAQRFNKELVVESRWESSFIGAVAIPLAMNQYAALYRALVTKLVEDAEFRAAAAP